MMSSPLSEAPEAPTTPSSYATAETPGNIGGDEKRKSPFDFSNVRRLPREIERQCQIFIEEHLYVNALQMYNQMLVSGQTRQEGPKKPTVVAPPAQLGLILTLTVHPHRTTRLKEKADIDIVSAAWTYLRNLLEIAGPINANFEAAFRYVDGSTRRRASPAEPADDRIHSKYADSDSLFHCAQDFWYVVGWAFNCSVIFAERWNFWKPWLEFMITSIETDWIQRQYLDERATGESDGAAGVSNRRESLLMSYVRSAGTGRSRAVHIVRALFADGNQTSRRLFREVFRNETKELIASEQRDLVGSVDLDNDEYGGYMNFTDSEGEQDQAARATPKTPKTPHTPQTMLTGEIPDGIAESVNMRLRLLDILAIAEETLPNEMVGLDKLDQELSRRLREEPVNVFQLYLNELRKQAEYDERHREVVVAVLSDLFNELLPPAYADPRKYRDPDQDGLSLTPLVLVRCYLPWPAGTDDLEDNARVALLHEAALLLVDADQLAATEGVRQAAAKGIQARKAKTEAPRRRGRRAANAHPRGLEVYLRETIELSGERMLAYIDCLRHGQEDGP